MTKRHTLRRSLRTINLSYAIGMLFTTFNAGLALTQFGKMLKMSEFGFGLLGSLPTFAQISQLLGSYFVERYGRRKGVTVVCGLTHRGLWFLIALIPLIFPIAWGYKALLVLFTLSYLCFSLQNPGHMSWFSDLIPSRIRGRFFARRLQLANLVCLVGMFLVGYVLDRGQSAGPETMQTVLVGLLLAGSVIGIIEYLMLATVPEPATHTVKPNIDLWTILKKPFSDRDFRFFLAYYGTISFSGVFIMQFAFLYLLDVAKMSNIKVTVLTTVIPVLINAVLFPFWGRIADRIGYKAVFCICPWLAASQALWFLLVQPDRWLGPYLLGVVGMIFQPGIEIGMAVYILKKSHSKNSAGPNTSYLAAFGIVMSLLGALSGILGGSIAQYLGPDWHYSIGGLSLTYHGVLFLIAGVLRLSSLLWLFGLENPKPSTIGQTLRQGMAQIQDDALRFLGQPKRLAFSYKRSKA